MYNQLPMNPMQLMMLGQSQNNPQQQQQLMNTFSLMNYTSPMGYFANQEAQLPSFLQFGPSVGQTQGQQARTSFMQNTAKPSNALARSNEQKYGGSGNSFAVQRTAAQRAANNVQANQVEQDARNAEISRLIAMRQAYQGMPQSQPISDFMPPSTPQPAMSSAPGTSNVGMMPGGMMNGLSIAKGVDNFLGGTLSNLASNAGRNIGSGINSFMTAPANPLSRLFGGRP